MIALLRLLIILLFIQTVLYVVLLSRARFRHRRRLEREWHETSGESEIDAYIEQGMADYETSLRRHLLYGIYIVPLALVAFLVYATNFM